MTEYVVLLDSEGKFMDLVDAEGQPVSFAINAPDDVEDTSEELEDFLGCEHCGKTDAVLKNCKGCDAVQYCGAECQRADWAVSHKQECDHLAIGPRYRGRGGAGRGGAGYGRRGGAGYGGRRGSLYYTPRYRGRRGGYYRPRGGYGRRGYGGLGGYWLWRSLYGNYGWYNPYYYNYWRSWYPQRYHYPGGAGYGGTGVATPPLPTFDTKTSPPESDKTLKALREKHADFTQRTGYIIVPDYQTGRFRWVAPE